MMRRRKVKKGSFGAHLEEVVNNFPSDARHARSEASKRDAASLRETRDIHTMLFERAWQIDRAKRGSGPSSGHCDAATRTAKTSA